MAAVTDYLRVSYSSLNTFASCARKFEFDKLHKKPVWTGEDGYAGSVGNAMHAGFQDYLVNKDEDSAVWAMMQRFPFDLEAQQPNDYRSFEACLSTLELMIAKGSLYEYELAMIRRPPTVEESAAGILGVTVPAIEVPFEIRIKNLVLPDGRGIAFTGFIDAIMQHYMTRAFRTMDIKTTRVRRIDATAKFKFDSQQVPYGIIVDHLAQSVVDSFEVLYLDCYIDILEPAVELYPFRKSREDLQEWCTNRLMQFNAIKQFMAMDYFPRTDGGCEFYQRPCRYLEPCMSRDRAALEDYFLLGQEPAPERPWFPWVIAELDLGVEA